MTPSLDPWIQELQPHLHFGDERLTDRCLLMMQRMADNPTASTNGAADGQAEAKAAYRFLSSPTVTPEALYHAMRQTCVERIREHDLVLAIQDTSSLDFTTHRATTGLGPIGGGDGTLGRGLLVHTALVASSDGVPLGILHQKTWARDEHSLGISADRRQRPIEDKESFRWIETMRAVEAAVPADVAVLHVADREADIFELFAEPRRANSYVLVRVAHPQRRIIEAPGHLGEAVLAAPIERTIQTIIPRTATRPARRATLELRVCPVQLRPPHNGVRDPKRTPVPLTAILVQELNAPAGVEPIEWLLVTDYPLSAEGGAEQVVAWYKLRWLIERFHYTLKSGCKIEDSQLRTAQGLQRLLALYCLVAFRLLWMTYEAREHPEAPCTEVFAEVEWHVLWIYYHRGEPLPAAPPTLREAVRYVARLGGFKARKCDGEPGVKVLWTGLMRLQDMAIGFMLPRPQDVGKE